MFLLFRGSERAELSIGQISVVFGDRGHVEVVQLRQFAEHVRSINLHVHTTYNTTLTLYAISDIPLQYTSSQFHAHQIYKKLRKPRRAQHVRRAYWCTVWHFSGENLLMVNSPVTVVIHPNQTAIVMKPSFWLTIYMYKQLIKNQSNSNIWITVKFEEQHHNISILDRICEHTYIFKFILKASRVNVMLNSAVRGVLGCWFQISCMLSLKM